MAKMRTPDGLELAYEVAGEGPLAVILQHGWASTRQHFELMLAHLPRQGRTYVCLDLAGHGESGDRPNAHSVAAYSAQLLAVADHLRLPRFVTVGHSMGAKFNQHLRLSAPARLLGQVAIAPSPAGLATEEASDEVIEQMSSLSGQPAGMEGMLRGLITAPVPDAFITKWAERAARIPASVLAASMRAIAQTDFEADLVSRGSKPPTLVIGGAADPIYVADAVTRRVARETPYATLRMLDCGHDVPNERPYETALLIDGFLAGLAPAS